jgi:thiol-disulfide isomerase/thioredoxin
MKMTLAILTIGIFFTVSIKAQKKETFLTSKLISGYPVEMEPIVKQLRLSNLSYSNLETGIDSVKVVFGRLTQGEQNGYWISSYIKTKLKTFQTVELVKNESTQSLTNTVDITYDNNEKKISVQLTHNTLTNEIQYLWFDNNNQKSKIASIIRIKKNIEKDKPFPSLTVKSLKGDNVSIKDFIGKYIVINWWTITCAPCIKEIPGLNSLIEKYKSNSEVVFLAVAFDKKEGLEYFLNLKKFNYMQTLGDSETAKLFGESFPKNIIVNPQGITTYYSEGGFEDKYLDIDKELKRQLNKE